MYCADFVECYKGWEIYAIRGGYIAQRGNYCIDEVSLSALYIRIDRKVARNE